MVTAKKTSWSEMESWIEERIQLLHRHTKLCKEVQEMSEDLPKQELLKKLLKMTTSENDGECIVAIRKANALLKVAGWDWDRLLDGKIKVIEDPFKTVADPFAYQDRDGRKPTPQPPHKPVPRPAAPQQPSRPGPSPYSAQTGQSAPQNPAGAAAAMGATPRSAPRGNPIASTKVNVYAGWCYCCGNPVQGQQGFIFDPQTRNRGAKSKWQIVCKPCNVLDYPSIGTSSYPRQKPLSAGGPAPSLSDI